MLDAQKHEDKVILMKNLSRITKDYFDFLKKHEALLSVYEELHSGFEAHKATLQSVADEIDEEGVLFNDENIEIKKINGSIMFFPKAIYKENPKQ